MEIKVEIIAVNGIANGRSTGFGNNPNSPKEKLVY